jgi:hypothetical protein
MLLLTATSFKISPIDSLKTVSHHLGAKIDSLKLSISAIDYKLENLDKITYIQITAFILIVTIIVAIAGFLSWGTLFVSIRRREANIRTLITNQFTEQNLALESLNETFEKKYTEFTKAQNAISSQAMRSMYFHAIQYKEYAGALIFSLRLMQYYSELSDLSRMDIWFKKAKEALQFPFRKNGMDIYFQELQVIMMALKSYPNEEFSNKIIELNDEIFKKKYANIEE